MEVVVIPDTQIMYTKSDNANVFDLYEVDSLRVEGASNPFVHGVEIAGPKGEVVRFRSVFDDGALVNAIDETLYHTLKGRLAALVPSGRILRMADGRKVAFAGEWRGRVTVKGISREGTFEVFKSNKAWAMFSVAAARAGVFAILVNKFCKIMKIFQRLDLLISRWVLCQC